MPDAPVKVPEGTSPSDGQHPLTGVVRALTPFGPTPTVTAIIAIGAFSALTAQASPTAVVVVVITLLLA